MKFREIRPGVTELRARSWALSGVLAALAAFYLILLVRAIGGPDTSAGAVVSVVAGVLIALAGAALLYEDNAFLFDAVGQELTWRQLFLLRKRTGKARFDEIGDVFIDPGVREGRSSPPCRLVVSVGGAELPLTRSYSASREECEAAATKIMDIMTRKADDVMEDSLKRIVASGRKADAVELARDHYGFSVEEARELVDGL